jgi:hypothetical protein
MGHAICEILLSPGQCREAMRVLLHLVRILPLLLSKNIFQLYYRGKFCWENFWPDASNQHNYLMLYQVNVAMGGNQTQKLSLHIKREVTMQM